MTSILKSGYLKKQGPKAFSAMKLRYFILSNDSLKYFKKQSDPTPAGVLDLDSSAKVEKGSPIKNERFIISVKTSLSSTGPKVYRDRTYIFAAGSETEVNEWVEAISKVVKKDGPAPAKSGGGGAAAASSSSSTPAKTSTPAGGAASGGAAPAAAPGAKDNKKGPLNRPDLTVLVCCATGNIGKLLVPRLVQRQVTVRAATRDPSAHANLAGKGVQVVELNYEKPETLDKALEGVDKVVFMQALSPSLLEDGKKLLEAIKRHPSVQHIIKVSPIGMDICNYTLAKWHQDLEKGVRDLRINFTFLRPNNFSQSMVNLYAESIKSTGSFSAPYGDCQVTYVDLRDIANVAAESVTKEEYRGRTIDINGDQPITHHQISELLTKLLNRKITYNDIGYDKYRELAKEKGVPGVVIELQIGQFQFSYKAAITSNVGPEVEEITGSKPIQFETWLKENISEFEKKQLILVTGATGSVGRALIDRLSTESTVVVRARSLESQLVEFSFSKPDSIERGMKGCEKIFFLNAFGPGMLDEGKKLLDFVKRCPTIKHIVKVSAVGIEGANYQVAKQHLELEELIKKCGIEWTMIRANSLHQNIGNFFASSIKSSSAFHFPVGDSKIASVDARDVANVAAEAILHDEFKGKTVNVNGPESLNHTDIAEIISRVVQRRVTFKDITKEEYVKTMKGYGAPDDMIQCLVGLYEEGFKKSKLSTVTYDVKDVTGHAPITFEEYVRDHIYDFAADTTVLVVGASGNLGPHVVEGLLRKHGMNVRAGTRNVESRKSGFLRHLGAHITEFNYNKPETMQAALTGVDKVFWLQPLTPSMVEDAKKFMTALQQTEGNIRHIVRVSVNGAEDSDFPVGKWHLEVEKLLKGCGANYTILRLNPVLSNLQVGYANSIKAGSFSAPFAECKVAYLDPRDLASTVGEIMASEDYNGKTLTLTGTEVVTHNDIAQTISKVIGKDVGFNDMDEEVYEKIFTKFGYPKAVVESNLVYYREVYRKDKLATPTSHVEDILGRRAKRCEQYIRDYKAAFVAVPKYAIAVTGASGTVGSKVVKSLLARRITPGDFEVRALVREAGAAAELDAQGAHVIEIDPKNLEAALDGVNRLVIVPPYNDDMANVDKGWIDAAKKAGVLYVVRYGALGSSRRNSPVAQWHDDGEQYLRASGIPFSFVRSTMLMNQFLEQMESMQENGKFYHKLGPGKVSFVDARDVGDVVAGVVAAPDFQVNNGQSFNMTGPESVHCDRVAQIFAGALQRTVRYIDVTDDATMAKKWKEQGHSDQISSGVAFLCDLLRRGYGDFLLPTFENVTGKQGRTFEQFARHVVGLFREEEE